MTKENNKSSVDDAAALSCLAAAPAASAASVRHCDRHCRHCLFRCLFRCLSQGVVMQFPLLLLLLLGDAY